MVSKTQIVKTETAEALLDAGAVSEFAWLVASRIGGDRSRSPEASKQRISLQGGAAALSIREEACP